MDPKIVEDIRHNWNDKSSDELLQIWKENDREHWSGAAFEAVRQILTERGIELPPQNPAKEAKSKPTPQRSRHRTSARIFIVLVGLWWVLVIAGRVSELSTSAKESTWPPLLGAGIAFAASCFWYVELGQRELRQPLLLGIGLVCAVLTFYGLFQATLTIVSLRDNPAYAFGSLIPVLILGFLSYILSFKR